MNVYQRVIVFIARFLGVSGVVIGLERFVNRVVMRGEISTTMAEAFHLIVVGSLIYVFSAKIGIELGKDRDDPRVKPTIKPMGRMDEGQYWLAARWAARSRFHRLRL
jgi:hypothetical protein